MVAAYVLSCAAIRSDLISVSRCSLLSHFYVFFCDISSVCSLNMVTIFFPFIFPSYGSVDRFVVAAVSGQFPLSFFAKFCSFQVAVLMHLHNLQCLRVVVLLLFLTHIVCSLSDVRPCLSALVSLSSCRRFSSVYFKNGSEYHTSGMSLWFILSMIFLQQNFFSSPPVWWCPFLMFFNTGKFPFLRLF